METIIAVVKRLINRLEGFEVVSNLLFGFAVIHHNDSAEDDQSVGRSLSIKLNLLFGGGDGRLD